MAAALAAPGVVVGTLGEAGWAGPPRLCAAGLVHQGLAKGRAAKGRAAKGRAAKGERPTAALCWRAAKGPRQLNSEVAALRARRCAFHLILAIFLEYLTLSAAYEHCLIV